jgi:hypothetical protein
VFFILDEAAAAIGGWTALQPIKCVHLDSEGQDWEPWQAHDIGGSGFCSVCPGSATSCARRWCRGAGRGDTEVSPFPTP